MPFEEKLHPSSLLSALCKVRPRAFSWVIIRLDKGLALFCNSQARLSCANALGDGTAGGGGEQTTPTLPCHGRVPGQPGSCGWEADPGVVPMPLEGPQLAALPVPVPALPGAALRAGVQLLLRCCQPFASARCCGGVGGEEQGGRGVRQPWDPFF